MCCLCNGVDLIQSNNNNNNDKRSEEVKKFKYNILLENIKKRKHQQIANLILFACVFLGVCVCEGAVKQ